MPMNDFEEYMKIVTGDTDAKLFITLTTARGEANSADKNRTCSEKIESMQKEVLAELKNQEAIGFPRKPDKDIDDDILKLREAYFLIEMRLNIHRAELAIAQAEHLKNHTHTRIKRVYEKKDTAKIHLERAKACEKELSACSEPQSKFLKASNDIISDIYKKNSWTPMPDNKREVNDERLKKRIDKHNEKILTVIEKRINKLERRARKLENKGKSDLAERAKDRAAAWGAIKNKATQSGNTTPIWLAEIVDTLRRENPQNKDLNKQLDTVCSNISTGHAHAKSKDAKLRNKVNKLHESFRKKAAKISRDYYIPAEDKPKVEVEPSNIRPKF